ncbi:hypothetical protein ACTWPT_31395 [Nonomuraea sp. 3N208]|uniref:hypothetical protein n=1 Tax=Nonomuraea sp. 3N208 TaxID=3457421 RepID=UPI003FCF0F09
MLTMVVTGEVRPAVALAVLEMSPLLATVFTIEVSSTSAALAVIALAGHRQWPGIVMRILAARH